MKPTKYLKPWLTAATLCIALLPCSGKVYRHVNCKSELIMFSADSIDCRNDLTRLYGRLTGMPHTSQRLDSLTIKVNGKAYGATDIDGVDFKRWFQWEEDGEIPVEIDFPRLSPWKTATVEAVTPRGQGLWILTIE